MLTPPRALERLGLPGRIVRRIGGHANMHWLADSGGTRVVLRRYHPTRTLEQVFYELAVLERVAAIGWPVATAIVAPVEIDGCLWCAFPFLDGRSRRPRTNASVRAEQRERGRLIASLHLDLASVTDLGQRPGWVRRDEVLGAREDGPTLRTLLHRMRRAHPEASAVLQRYADRTQKWLDELEAGRLPTVLVHGDVHPGNLLFRAGKLSAVLDFDLTHLDHRVTELVWTWRGRHTDIVLGFNDVAPLEPIEWELLTPVMWSWYLDVLRMQLLGGPGRAQPEWFIERLERRSALTGHLRPLTRRPTSSRRTTLDAVASDYGLGRIVAATKTTSSWLNDVWRVDAHAGTYAVHLYGPDVNRRHLEAMQQVRRELADAGLPAVAAETDRRGHTIFERTGRYGEVQRWVRHDRFADGWKDMREVSSTLAMVHDVLATSDAQPEQADDPWISAEVLKLQLDRAKDRLSEAAHAQGKQIDDELRQARGILDELARASMWPEQLTQGDPGGRNVLMRGRRVAAVLDFGRLERRPRMYDLAHMLFFHLLPKHGDVERLPWNQARACCTAYARSTSRSVTDDQWRSLVRLLAYTAAAGIAVAPKEHQAVAEVIAFGQWLPLARWALDDPDRAVRRLVE